MGEPLPGELEELASDEPCGVGAHQTLRYRPLKAITH